VPRQFGTRRKLTVSAEAGSVSLAFEPPCGRLGRGAGLLEENQGQAGGGAKLKGRHGITADLMQDCKMQTGRLLEAPKPTWGNPRAPGVGRGVHLVHPRASPAPTRENPRPREGVRPKLGEVAMCLQNHPEFEECRLKALPASDILGIRRIPDYSRRRRRLWMSGRYSGSAFC
jgi:hypothetical protein